MLTKLFSGSSFSRHDGCVLHASLYRGRVRFFYGVTMDNSERRLLIKRLNMGQDGELTIPCRDFSVTLGTQGNILSLHLNSDGTGQNIDTHGLVSLVDRQLMDFAVTSADNLQNWINTNRMRGE